MNGMIGIYGANGFIGRHLVRRLARRGAPVRAVSRWFDADFTRPFRGLVDFVDADLQRAIDMASSLQDVETVVQLISTSSPSHKNDNPVADIHENVIPQVDFLQACVRSGVKRYVFLSSGGAVYGPHAPTPTPETSPTDPISSHGVTKLTVEKYIRMHGHVDGLEYAILRVANPFGPGQTFRKGQGLIPAILDRWQKGLPIRIFGDGQAMRDYIYIDDVIDAVEAALFLPGSPRLVLNVGSGKAHSVIDVVEAIEAAACQRFQREYVDARKTDVDIAWLDISSAGRVLGWVPRTEFREGIAKTISSRAEARTSKETNAI
jgi:UDP-glucose 4-epimerase